MASANDRTESRDVSNIPTSQIRTCFGSSSFGSLHQDYLLRFIVDTETVNKMNQATREKVDKFLEELSSSLQSKNIQMSKFEYFLANEQCQPTFEFVDELENYFNNRRAIPNLETVINGLGASPNNTIHYILTSWYKKKKLQLAFPTKLHKTVVLDFGKNVQFQDLPYHQVVPCFAKCGLPSITDIVELLTLDSGSSLGSIASTVQLSPRQQTAEYRRDVDEVEDDISNEGYTGRAELGRGGYGIVYGYSKPNSKSFAVKFQPINDDTRKDIDNELDIFEILTNNSIFAVIPFEHIRTNAMMAQIFHVYPKGSLSQCMRNTRLTINEKENIMGALSQGLSWLCTKSILHLDIKLSNILVDNYLRPTLSDFGLARLGPETILDLPVGTPGFTPPETYITRTVNHRSDIFGLGMAFYTLLNHHNLLTERQNKYRYNRDFWASWNPIVRCGRWSGMLERMISVNNEERPTAEEVLVEIRQERGDCYFPFNLRDGDRHTLNGRATIDFVLCKYANAKHHESLKAADFTSVFPRFAGCIGLEYLRKLPRERMTFVDGEDTPPSNGKEFMIKRKSGKKYEVRLYLSKTEINLSEVKEYFWTLLKQITIALMIELGRHPDMDQDELSIRLDRFLSLY